MNKETGISRLGPVSYEVQSGNCRHYFCKFCRDIDQFVLSRISELALPISHAPVRHHR